VILTVRPQEKASLERRVIDAAEAALAEQQYVSAIDVLVGMRLLAMSNVNSWRKGRLEHLEEMVQGSAEKVITSLSIFQRWAVEKGLKPIETRYVRQGREGSIDLKFTIEGDPGLEKFFRTHWVSTALSERQQRKLQEKQEKTEIVVFQVVRDTKCAECGTEIDKDDFLWMDAQQPLCMACAGLGDLEFLPSGDTALTRRAGKYSARRAVVVRFSRSRGRYERQGVLVETAALEKAEQECAGDASERASDRARNAARRAEDDRALVKRMTEEMRALFPRCPPDEVAAIARHTAQRGSGRVGRTAAGRKLDPQALTAAVVAAVRHRHTNYDELLLSGFDREGARQRVARRVDETLDSWRQ
jgi:hypothetical protein